VGGVLLCAAGYLCCDVINEKTLPCPHWGISTFQDCEGSQVVLPSRISGAIPYLFISEFSIL